MPSSSTYPSIPVPQDNIDSMYQSVLAMRQTVQLLIVNAQTITDQTITKASQIFSKKSDHADVSSTLNNSLTTVNKSISSISQSLGTLQTSVTALQGQMTALQIRMSAAESGISSLTSRMAIAEGNITNLQTRVTTLEAKFPQASSMQQITTPYTTNSTSYVMMGINLTTRPIRDTQGLVIIDGQLANGTNGQSTKVIICYGIGTPPVAGVPQVGTILTQPAIFQSMAGGSTTGPFSLAGIVTGLIPSANYWFDLAVSVTGGLGTVSSVDATAHSLA